MNSARRSLRAPVALLVRRARDLARRLLRRRRRQARPSRRRAPAGTHARARPRAPCRSQAAGAPGTLADADRDAIIATLRKYVIAATIDPLHGKPVGDLAPLFTPEAAAALAGPEPRRGRSTKACRRRPSTVKATRPPVPLAALSDPTGAIDLVGASLVPRREARSATGGPVRVQRTGELVLQARRRHLEDRELQAHRRTAPAPDSPTPTTELDGEDRAMITHAAPPPVHHHRRDRAARRRRSCSPAASCSG